MVRSFSDGFGAVRSAAFRRLHFVLQRRGPGSSLDKSSQHRRAPGHGWSWSWSWSGVVRRFAALLATALLVLLLQVVVVGQLDLVVLVLLVVGSCSAPCMGAFNMDCRPDRLMLMFVGLNFDSPKEPRLGEAS